MNALCPCGHRSARSSLPPCSTCHESMLGIRIVCFGSVRAFARFLVFLACSSAALATGFTLRTGAPVWSAATSGTLLIFGFAASWVAMWQCFAGDAKRESRRLPWFAATLLLAFVIPALLASGWTAVLVVLATLMSALYLAPALKKRLPVGATKSTRPRSFVCWYAAALGILMIAGFLLPGGSMRDIVHTDIRTIGVILHLTALGSAALYAERLRTNISALTSVGKESGLYLLGEPGHSTGYESLADAATAEAAAFVLMLFATFVALGFVPAALGLGLAGMILIALGGLSAGVSTIDRALSIKSGLVGSILVGLRRFGVLLVLLSVPVGRAIGGAMPSEVVCSALAAVFDSMLGWGLLALCATAAYTFLGRCKLWPHHRARLRGVVTACVTSFASAGLAEVVIVRLGHPQAQPLAYLTVLQAFAMTGIGLAVLAGWLLGSWGGLSKPQRSQPII